MIEQPESQAAGYITDGHGTVRIKADVPKASGGYDGDAVDYFYRMPGDRTWLPLSHVVGDGVKQTGFTPLAVDRDLDVAYGFDAHDGRIAVYKVALDGSMKKDLVYARPDVDIAGLVKVGRQQRVVGVSYVTDKRHTAFFDPELKALAGQGAAQ